MMLSQKVSKEALAKVVNPVKTGIQFLGQTRDLLDFRLRGNDGHGVFSFLQETQIRWINKKRRMQGA
jgi:hypothetical protein